jgi:Prp8 binding protein
VITCGPDRTVRCWDAHRGEQVKTMKGHSAFVNSCAPATRGAPLVVSGSDDGGAVYKLRIQLTPSL